MSDWLKNLKIGIVGGGVVGQATARSYLEHVVEVRVYDIKPERRTHSLSAVLETDLVFVCLPTPQKKEALECDTSAIDEFFKEVNLYSISHGLNNFVLRSTVPIGTTRRLAELYKLPNLVHSPEFLTARCALVDAQIPARNVIGQPNWKGTAYNSKGLSILEDLYRQRFPHVSCQLMSSDESEAVKLFQNGFFAVKVAYWNEVRCLADKLGLDWEAVMIAILADGRIHPSHTQVPGPDGKRGFGSACLPKDLASLIAIGREYDLLMSMTSSAHSRNYLVDRKDK